MHPLNVESKEEHQNDLLLPSGWNAITRRFTEALFLLLNFSLAMVPQIFSAMLCLKCIEFWVVTSRFSADHIHQQDFATSKRQRRLWHGRFDIRIDILALHMHNHLSFNHGQCWFPYAKGISQWSKRATMDFDIHHYYIPFIFKFQLAFEYGRHIPAV